MTLEEIKDYARKTKGCDVKKASYQWRGCDVYIPDYHGIPTLTKGPDCIFLVRDDEIIISSPAEASRFQRHTGWIDKQFGR